MNPNKFKLRMWGAIILGVILIVYFLDPECERLFGRSGDPRHLERSSCLAKLAGFGD